MSACKQLQVVEMRLQQMFLVLVMMQHCLAAGQRCHWVESARGLEIGCVFWHSLSTVLPTPHIFLSNTSCGHVAWVRSYLSSKHGGFSRTHVPMRLMLGIQEDDLQATTRREEAAACNIT